MSATITLDKSGLEGMFEYYAQVKKRSVPDALRINARLLAVELARRTQPFGDKTGKEKIGEGAIVRDLIGGKNRYGVFAALKDYMIANAEQSRASDNVRLFVTKDGRVYGTDKAHYLPDATQGEMRSIHKSKFVNGKMSSAGGRTRDIGRWKFVDKYYVQKKELDDYVATQKKKVGIAKSGWAACAKALKGAVKGSPTRGIPGWVTRHLKDYTLGNVQDLADDPANARIVLTNTCRYIDKVCPESERNAAVVIVVNKMLKEMQRILRYERKKAAQAA